MKSTGNVKLKSKKDVKIKSKNKNLRSSAYCFGISRGAEGMESHERGKQSEDSTLKTSVGVRREDRVDRG